MDIQPLELRIVDRHVRGFAKAGNELIHGLATTLGAESVDDPGLDRLKGLLERWLTLAVADVSHLEYTPEVGTGGLAIRDLLVSGQPSVAIAVDSAGQVVRKIEPTGETGYHWDPSGRLTKVSKNASVVLARYAYDLGGLRRSATSQHGISEYVWSGEDLIEEGLPNGTGLLHLAGPAGVVAVGSERVLHDALWNAIARKAPSGGVRRFRFDAWGNYRGSERPGYLETAIGYTGHLVDTETGLAYAQQRWLDTSTGRFMSVDSVGASAYLEMPQGLNPWLYAHADPTRFMDPDGRAVVLATAGIGALIGGVAGCAMGAWTAADGEGWSGCGKGLIVGGAAGGLAGLTFGASLGATGAVGLGGTAVVGKTALIGGGAATTGSVLIAGTVAGSVGGVVSGAGNVLINGGSTEQAQEAAAIGAFTGALGGAVGSVAGSVAGSYVFAQSGSRVATGLAGGGAAGFAGDAVVQSVLVASGVQEEFSFAQLALATGGGAFVGGLVGARAEGMGPEGNQNLLDAQAIKHVMQGDRWGAVDMFGMEEFVHSFMGSPEKVDVSGVLVSGAHIGFDV